MIIFNVQHLAEPRPTKGGSDVLAQFDFTIEGVTLHGCALVRTPNGRLAIWTPYCPIGEPVKFSRALAGKIIESLKPLVGMAPDAPPPGPVAYGVAA